MTTTQQTLFECPSPWWHDEALLDGLYNERGLSTTVIADDVFGGEISSETARSWLERHDLIDKTDASHPQSHYNALLEAAESEDDEEEPHEKYTKAGRKMHA